MFSDLRYALRTLRRSPGFSAAVVLVLGLGIGLNTALFSLVNAVLLRPLPGFETEGLAILYERTGKGSNWVRLDTLKEWTKQARSFERLEAGAFFEMNLTGDRPAEQINTAMLTPLYFSLYRMQPAYGRTFAAEEGEPGRGQVAVLDFQFWQRRFAADPKIVGQSITLDSRPYVVAGVADRDFHPLGANVSLYRPLAIADPPVGAAWVVGRLRPGATLTTAQAEMNTISRRLQAADPARFKDVEAQVLPILEPWVSNIRPLLLLLAGAVAMVLLIACANVASLLLARGASRQREFAIRAALGASNARLAIETTAEGVLLALAGGAAALVVAWRTVPLLNMLRLDGIPRLDEVSLDGRVLAFAAAISLATGILCSVLPARAAGRPVGPSSRRQNRVRAALVVSEVGLTCLLLWGACLLWQTFRNMQHEDLGFDPHGVLTFSLLQPDSDARDGRKEAAFDERVIERLRRIPGVETVAATTELPIFGLSATMAMKIAGRPEPGPNEPKAEMRIVSPEYFAAMRMTLRRGRNFTPRDRWGAPGVAIVNEAAARRYFDGQNPIGRRLLVPEFAPGMRSAGPESPREIVGVVADVRQYSLKDPPVPHLYLPLEQNAIRYTMFAIRTRNQPEQLVASVQRAVAGVDKDLPAAEFDSMDSRMAFLTSQPRASTTLFALFGALAALLAGLGIYSVVSYATRRRTHEIGIRMAVGARGQDVLRMVLLDAARWTAAGLGIGGALLAIFRRMLESYLFGVRATDPATAAAVCGALMALAMAAAMLPAARAALLDPMTALRHE